jgi:hypothetical protein
MDVGTDEDRHRFEPARIVRRDQGDVRISRCDRGDPRVIDD